MNALRHRAGGLAAAALAIFVLAAPAFAQPADAEPAAAAAEAANPPADAGQAGNAAVPEAGPAAMPDIGIELNRLEDVEGACRGYFIVHNGTDQPLSEMQLDVFLFDPDGIAIRRVALAFMEVRAERDKVVLFDLADLGCGQIGRVLVNEVLACTAPGGPVDGCAESLTAMSRLDDVPFEY